MSKRDEWYRSPDWDPATQEMFERRLNRARAPYDRAQNTKLKALSLLRTRDPAKRRAAIELLHRVVRDHGEDPSHMVRLMVVEGCELLAQAYEEDGEFEKAEEQYRTAIQLCTIQPRTPSDSEMRLAQLIVRTRQHAKFGEARELISLDPVFADKRFAYLVAEARMAALEGDEGKAAICAGAALGIYRQQKPPLPRIPTFGVAEPDDETLLNLQELASHPGPAAEEDLNLLPAWLLRAGGQPNPGSAK
jgi:tetratricopeptide (TPR) repeat protein